MFEKVSRYLKYDSNIFLSINIYYIYMDTTTNHFTPLALRVRGNNEFLGEIGAELYTILGDREQ